MFHSLSSETWETDWIQKYQPGQIFFYGLVDFHYPEDESTITGCTDLSQTLDQLEWLKRRKRCIFCLELNPSSISQAVGRKISIK